MDEDDPDLKDYNYGPESYDAVDDHRPGGADRRRPTASTHAGEIVNVSPRAARSARTYADCMALIEAGTTDIDYDGVSGPHGHVRQRRADRRAPTPSCSLGDDNRIDDSKTTFKGGRGSADEVNDIPLTETEGTRAGDGVLKIGTLLPETGSLAFLGPPEIAGVKVAIEEINDGRWRARQADVESDRRRLG